MSRTLHYSLKTRTDNRPGFILVVTIMLLAVTAIIVTGISRHSMLLATSAKTSKLELQEKWAVASCQRFWLGRGDEVLRASNQSKLVFNVNLSGFEIVNEIRDESSKFDINSIYGQTSDQQLKQLILSLLSSNQLTIDMKPFFSRSGRDTIRKPFESWGQVFESDIDTNYLELRQVSDKLTCWGNKLNIRTANPETLEVTIKTLAGNILAGRFLQSLRDQPNSSLANLLIEIDANERQSRLLNLFLTDKSWATSIWTDVFDENRRTSYFTVQQRPVENIFRYQTFRW